MRQSAHLKCSPSLLRHTPSKNLSKQVKCQIGQLDMTVLLVERMSHLLATPEEICEQLFHRNVQRFRGGLVLRHRDFVDDSTPGLRVIKKKDRVEDTGTQLSTLGVV